MRITVESTAYWFKSDIISKIATRTIIMENLLRCLSLGLLMMLFVGSGVAAENQTKDVKSLINDFNSPSVDSRINAAKIVARSSFDSPELFKTIQSLLAKDYNSSTDSEHVDEMSWLCKALSSSGDQRYAVLLQEVANKADHQKLRKYARQSIEQIDENAKRQEVINAKSNWNAKLTDQENRLINMLNSGDPATVRDAAKTIYRSKVLDSAVYDDIEKNILTMLPNVSGSPLYSDTVAWLCKALSISANGKYAKTLNEVVSSAPNISLKSHARKALSKL